MSSNKKILLLLCLCYAGSGFAAGVLESLSRVPGLLEHGVGIAPIIGIYVWCREDLASRIPHRSPRWALWSALLAFPVLPAYFFRTRPTVKALKSLARVIGAYVGLEIVFALAAALGGIARAA